MREASLQPHVELTRNVVAAGAELSYRIINDGSAALMFGGEYRLEVGAGTEWQPAQGPTAFAAWAATVAPGEQTGELPVCTSWLAPGHYRLGTSVRVLADDGSADSPTTARLLAAEFDVVDDED